MSEKNQQVQLPKRVQSLVMPSKPSTTAFQFIDNRQSTKQLKQLKSIIQNSSVSQFQKTQTGTTQRAEDLSGHLSGTNIHWNSSKPAEVGAHAYASGKDVHIASGQEKHVYHELGHVVQQSRGHVPVTTTVNGMGVNDNPTLEKQADTIGSQIKSDMKVDKNVQF